MKVYVTAHVKEVSVHRLAGDGVETEVVTARGQTVPDRGQYHVYAINTCVDRLLQYGQVIRPLYYTYMTLIYIITIIASSAGSFTICP